MYHHYKNGIFGHSTYYNLDSEFISFDSEEMLNKNLESQAQDWIYRNKKVFYSYNSYGHRSIEPELLNDGYLLFLGCSITEGVGLALEDCYSDVVANHFNTQYYNLGQGGSGPDLLVLNAMQFLAYVKAKPSKVIIQWPDTNRFFMVDENGWPKLYSSASGFSSDEAVIWKTMTIENTALRKNIYFRMILLNYLKNLGINDIYEVFDIQSAQYDQLIEFTEPYPNLNSKKVRFQYQDMIDTARDLLHPGIKMNRWYADTLIDAFSQ